MPHYPADAACATSRLPAGTWDDEVAGETDNQRALRIETAKLVCDTCPVTAACHARRWEGGGIRAGKIHPDRVPGYNGDPYIGLPAPRVAAQCGTDPGYQKHLREHEPACDDCRQAHSRRVIERKQAKRAADIAAA